MIPQKIKYITGIIPSLGWYNVAYILWYRFSFKIGYRQKKFSPEPAITGSFFRPVPKLERPYPDAWKEPLRQQCQRYFEGKLSLFSYHEVQAGKPPRWRQNLMSEKATEVPLKHWTQLSDFNDEWGDIKVIWEPSRLDWLTDLARGYRVFEEDRYLELLNNWLSEWSRQNPLNLGPNWKCGQETAIRLMKLLTTVQILDQLKQPNEALQGLVAQHLKRIAGNMRYAIAQDNNHGTSEAAGLWLGAAILRQSKAEQFSSSQLKRWEKKGKRILEERIQTLLGQDGTFSQQSATYHRLVCDTISWAWTTLEALDLKPTWTFATGQRLKALYEWQFSLTDKVSGDAPNLGANDGAMLEKLHSCGYRDFRPSTQMLGVLVNERRSYEQGAWDEALWWRYPKSLDFPLKEATTAPQVKVLDNTILLMQSQQVKLVCKLPNDRFRPSSEDTFHLDLWVHGQNLLRDSGTYSYNAGPKSDYYQSVKAHNTVQFGQEAQMPKLSRFLYGAWLKLESQEGPFFTQAGKIYWKGSYRDYQGNRHQRSIELDPEEQALWVEDLVAQQISDPQKHLYWHLPVQEQGQLTLSCWDEQGQRLEAQKKKCSESRYYLAEQDQQCWQFSTSGSRFITKITF